MIKVIKWLESPDGETWSRETHKNKHQLISIKDDLALADTEFDAFGTYDEQPLWVA